MRRLRPAKCLPKLCNLAYTNNNEGRWIREDRNHPNKHIREALNYAEERGWRIVMSKRHAYCRIYGGCGHHDCQKSIWSTPRNPEDHAKDIRDKVDACPGAATDGT